MQEAGARFWRYPVYLNDFGGQRFFALCAHDGRDARAPGISIVVVLGEPWNSISECLCAPLRVLEARLKAV